MSHRSHSLEDRNDDTITASFEEEGCACHVTVIDGEGDHKLTLQTADGATLELTNAQGLAIRNAVNRARLFAKHQGALKFQRLEREEQIRRDEQARKDALAEKEAREKQEAAERAEAQAKEAERRAAEARKQAEEAATGTQEAATDPADVPAPPLSEPDTDGQVPRADEPSDGGHLAL
jgi:hypothetical protein